MTSQVSDPDDRHDQDAEPPTPTGEEPDLDRTPPHPDPEPGQTEEDA